MPKRYTIVMRLSSDTNPQLAEATEEEFYDDDEQAKKKFAEKDKAARAAGKGKPSG
jgi:hypothetical protein